MTIHDTIAKLRKMLAAATPAKDWTYFVVNPGDSYYIETPAGRARVIVGGRYVAGDAELVGATMAALPDLLDRIEKLEELAQHASSLFDHDEGTYVSNLARGFTRSALERLGYR